MVTVEKINISLFPQIYESFLADDDPYSDEDDWRNLWDYQLDVEEDYCGYALVDDGVVVGILGMIFSQRNINGTITKFCNLHHWWVKENYRGYSLLLLRPVLKLNDHTITHFTTDEQVRPVAKKLGFKELDATLKILLPCQIFKSKNACDESTLTCDKRVIEKRLTESDKRIFLDHQPYDCGHLLVNDGDAYCYLVYTQVIRHLMPYCHIHYVSNKNIFAKMNRMVRSSLLANNDARFVAVDTRLVRDIELPFSFDFPQTAPELYKSSKLSPEQIDNLYSDRLFLKLSSFPDLSYELGRFARRLWRPTRAGLAG